MKKPLVSIICITFNQEQFIRQTLESFLMQETTFAFEVLVHDDASTDGTTAILREFQSKYPDIIKPVYETENQYNKNGFDFFHSLFREAKGKYIALCEGDDFWTDPTKLQRQVDFLEKHQDYAIVFHPVRVFFEKGEEEDRVFPDRKSRFTTQQLLRENFIQTNSVMYRSQGDYEDLVPNVMPDDWYLHLYHARFGKIGFIDRVMSAYRRHDGGVWWGDGSGRAVFLKKVIDGHLRLSQELKKMFADNKALYDEAATFIRKLVNETIVLNRDDVDFITKLVNQAPESAGETIISQYDKIEELKMKLDELENKNQELENKNQELQLSVESSNKELNEIKSSKAWQYAEKLRNAKGRAKRLIRR